MAMVDRVVTATTVKSTFRSVLSLCGITAAIASVADAPQIATAPPVIRAKRHCRPNSRAATKPVPIVSAISPATTTGVCQPNAAMSCMVMRMPSSPTPSRNTTFEANSTPGLALPSSIRKLKAMPISSAKSSAGPP